MDKFLVLGIASGGLFMARQLRKAFPDCIIYAIGDPQKDIGRYSNTINRFYGATTFDEIYKSILQAYIDIGKGKVRAYMCSNPILEFIVLRQQDVFTFLTFENTIDVYRQLVDKEKSDSFCKELGIKKPIDYSLANIESGQIHFPVVIKPVEKTTTIGAEKCAYINNLDELHVYLKKMSGLDIHLNKFICQQFIEGDNQWEYGYGGYFKEGQALVDIGFYQFKQVPQGLCCYSREITKKELLQDIRSLINPILKTLRYNGFIEFDIKQDANTKELFLLDINPRPWRSVELLKGKLGKSTVFQPQLLDKNVIWHYPYRSLFSYTNNKNVSTHDCKKISNKKPQEKVFYLYDKNDLRPYLKQLGSDMKEFFNKIIERIKRIF